MLIKINTAITILCLLGLIYLTATRNSSNIVYVDTAKLIDGYEGTKEARKQFEEKSKVWQANVDTLVKQWENEIKIYEKERSGMTDKEKQLKEELLQNKQQQLNQYQEAMQQKAREEDQLMTQTVMNEINDYLKEYGKEEGYTYILGANGGNIVYADEIRNITEEVLAGLNVVYQSR